jgi:hypothetical protein
MKRVIFILTLMTSTPSALALNIVQNPDIAAGKAAFGPTTALFDWVDFFPMGTAWSFGDLPPVLDTGHVISATDPITLNTVSATPPLTLFISNWIDGDGFNPNGVGFNRPSGAAGPDLAVNGPENFSLNFINAVTRLGFAVSTGLSNLQSEIDHTGAVFQVSTDRGDTGVLTLVDTGNGYSAWVDISSILPFHVLTFFEPSANVQDQYFGNIFAPAAIPEPSSLAILGFATVFLGVISLATQIGNSTLTLFLSYLSQSSSGFPL